MNRGVWWILVFLSGLAAQAALAQTKRDVPDLYDQAEEAYNSGKYKEARELLDAVLKLDPGLLEAYLLRGGTREQLDDIAGALTDYSIYLEARDDDNEAHLARGLLHYRQGHFDQARADFLQLLNHPRGTTNTVFFRQSSYAKGTDQVMTIQSGGRDYLFNYIGMCDTKLRDFASAISFFDSAIVINPREADYYVNRGIAKEAGNDSTARADYRRALKIDPSHGIARHNLSVMKSREGDKTSAENMLNEMLDADSTMIYAYVQRGYQRLEAGYAKGALEDYNEALKYRPSDATLYLARGIAKEKLKDYPGAFSDYTKAIDLKENMEKAWLNRGNVLVKLNRFVDAIEDYTVAITFTPDFAAAFYNRGIARYRLKQMHEACTDFKQAEKLGYTGDDKITAKACQAK